MVGSAAIALIDADHVHAGGEALLRESDHITGFARAFQAMHDQHGEGTAAIWLPVALAQNRNAGLDFDQAVVRLRKVGPAREEETGEGLQVAAAQKRARRERLETRVRLRAPHSLILNTGEHFCRAMRRRARERVMPIFEYVCRECRHRFEALVYGSQKAECPSATAGTWLRSCRRSPSPPRAVPARQRRPGRAVRAAIPPGPAHARCGISTKRACRPPAPQTLGAGSCSPGNWARQPACKVARGASMPGASGCWRDAAQNSW